MPRPPITIPIYHPLPLHYAHPISTTCAYPPPVYPRANTKQAAYHIGSGRLVRHEKSANDIAADRSGARHRAVDRGDLAMIGGRALGLQQGPHGDIVNAVRPTADDEGDSDNHEAYGRKTDQQHSRAHDRGGPKRSQADPAGSDERRVGKEGGRTCRDRGWP